MPLSSVCPEPAHSHPSERAPTPKSCYNHNGWEFRSPLHCGNPHHYLTQPVPPRFPIMLDFPSLMARTLFQPQHPKSIRGGRETRNDR